MGSFLFCHNFVFSSEVCLPQILFVSLYLETSLFSFPSWRIFLLHIKFLWHFFSLSIVKMFFYCLLVSMVSDKESSYWLVLLYISFFFTLRFCLSFSAVYDMVGCSFFCFFFKAYSVWSIPCFFNLYLDLSTNLLNFYFLCPTLSLFFWMDVNVTNCRTFSIVPQVPESLFNFFFNISSLCASDWIIAIGLSSTSLIFLLSFKFYCDNFSIRVISLLPSVECLKRCWDVPGLYAE